MKPDDSVGCGLAAEPINKSEIIRSIDLSARKKNMPIRNQSFKLARNEVSSFCVMTKPTKMTPDRKDVTCNDSQK